MFALVESGSITKYFAGNKGVTIGDTQYPKSIFTLWSESDRNAIGVYAVTINQTNKKNEKWYVNTDVTYSFANNKVTGSYGTATAKAHADTLWTQADLDNGFLPSDKEVGDVKTEGLKTVLIRDIKKEAAGILQETDWYIIRKADAGTAVPSSITTHRAAVRTKAAQMETSITNAADTAALETLFTNVNTGTEENPVMERPIGHLPTLED
jgi:hypothetical protein